MPSVFFVIFVDLKSKWLMMAVDVQILAGWRWYLRGKKCLSRTLVAMPKHARISKQ